MEYKAVKIFIFVLIAAAVTVFVSPVYAEKNKDIVATINGEDLSKEVFETEFNIFLKNKVPNSEVMPEKEMSNLKNKFLDDLITSLLLFQEARQQDLVTDDAEVDSKYTEFKESYAEDAEFESFIKENNLTEEKVKENIKKSLSIRALLKKNVEDKVSVSDEDILAFYNSNPQYFKQPGTVRASHILISANDATSPEDKKIALETINAIKKRLDNGEKFEDLAKEHSTCPSSKNGGDLGFFEKSKMVKPFGDAAFSMEVGEVSDVVQTEFGYHIIKVTDKKEIPPVPIDEAKGKISTYLKNQKHNEAMKTFIENLRKSGDIKKEMIF